MTEEAKKITPSIDFISKSLKDLSIDTINKMTRMITLDKKKKELAELNKPTIHKNTDTMQYKLLMKLLNLILTNMKSKNIKVATEFKSIHRRFIIDPVNLPGFNLLLPEILKHFNKCKCGVYNLQTPNLVYNCMRGMCRILGIRVISREYNRNVNKMTTTHFEYTII